ncbi:MAG TPA: DNA (cytosine-5-)-methyltransferase [Xanthomonadaceae bacterium]|jgi:DNA (cytosine-5)-methyltransferase 1|nr:DNA (cytosine-5-)-methyltransferase [Xanthomonadaceae bacterium]
MSAWLERAIQEKLSRDEVREDSGEYSCRKATRSHPDFGFYEFFAGGGMARAGLGERWDCLLANDFDAMKARTYRENWDGGAELIVGDINRLTIDDLPAPAHMAWASFPCQDLSLAGNYEGIGHWQDKVQTRSGTFWAFWRLMQGLNAKGKSPKLIVLENVYGILTANKSKDFAAIGSALTEIGYRFGAVVLDARHFVPQSRPRVFIVGVRSDLYIPPSITSKRHTPLWHPPRMLEAHDGLTEEAQRAWQWWKLPTPDPRPSDFVDIVEDEPAGVEWHTESQTKKLISMMSEVNLAKLETAKKSGRRTVGAVYKRTRADEFGVKAQRAEVRFDSIAGCLRTPAGGSSRQIILVVEGATVRSRLLSPREAARLMGLPDTYILPRNYNDAYHVAGDGVAVPVVAHLAKHVLESILDANK